MWIETHPRLPPDNSRPLITWRRRDFAEQMQAIRSAMPRRNPLCAYAIGLCLRSAAVVSHTTLSLPSLVTTDRADGRRWRQVAEVKRPCLAWLSVSALMLLSALVAADARMPAVAVAALAGGFGALQGLLNGATLATIGADASSLGGMVMTVFLLVLLASAAVVSLRAFWTRIAVRVAGSWVAAVGMLMLGWLFQGAG